MQKRGGTEGHGKALSTSMRIDRVEFQLTTRCSMRCMFCFQDPAQDAPMLGLDQVTQVLDELSSTLRTVWLTGGEPLLAGTLVYDAIHEAKRRGLYVGMSSNGLLLDEHSQRLAKAGLDEVRVSLDSTDARVYEHIRGVKGSYRRVLGGLARAVEAGLSLSVRCTVTRLNEHDIPQVIEKARECGAERVEVKSVLPIGKGDSAMMVPPQRLARIFASATAASSGAMPVQVMCNHLAPCRGFSVENNVACECADRYLYVYADGSIAPCSYFPADPAYRLDRCCVRDAWSSPLFRSIREELPRGCKGCDDWDACRNGCPAVLHAHGERNVYCYDVIGDLR